MISFVCFIFVLCSGYCKLAFFKDLCLGLKKNNNKKINETYLIEKRGWKWKLGNGRGGKVNKTRAP
jgi:hypothetical protein